MPTRTKAGAPPGAAAGTDLLCFDYVADAVKACRVKVFGGRRLLAEVSYKDVRAASREETVAVLRDLIQRGRKLGTVEIVLSLPAHFVITKNIEIPSQDPKEIRDIINLQAGRLTPYSRDEVIIDYVNIGVFRSSYTKLLLVIVNKEVVNRQLALFAQAGARVDRVLLGVEGAGCLVQQHLRLEVQDSVFALIHVDATSTDFGVFLKGRVIFARSIALGAQHLLAERDKHLARFIEELKKSLDAYQIEDIESPPTLVVFSGAISGLEDLEVMMLDAFRVPVKVLLGRDILPRAPGVGPEAIDQKGISFTGLGASAVVGSGAVINLIPEEVKMRLALEERGRDIIKAGILSLTALVVICVTLIVQIYLKSDHLKKLDAKFRTLNVQAAAIESEVARVRLIRKHLSVRGRALNILSEFYELTPLEISILNVRLRENGSFSVKGEAASMSAVFTYIGNLEKSSYFKEVKTRYTSKKKVEGVDLVDFEVSGVLETGEPV